MSQTKHRVFLLDDSPFALEVTRTALTAAGVDVVTGRDLSDLAPLAGEDFDLVLIDVEMPEIHGDDVVSWLRGRGLTAPVHLLSSLPPDELAARAGACGADGYIEKGLGLDGVAACVLGLLGLTELGRSLVPATLGAAFDSTARGRLRRVESALGRGEAGVATAELHTLAGEAFLLGLSEVAVAATDARAAVRAADRPAADGALAALTAALTAAADRAQVSRRPTTATGTGRVLLLDDSDIYRSTLMAMLEDAGLEVVEVRHLSEARRAMHDGRYAVAVLDRQLGDGLGTDLIPALRAHAPSTRIVVLSGDDAEPAGADRVLVKSIAPDDLVAAIVAEASGG